MTVVAALLTTWVAVRWALTLVGAIRVRKLEPSVRSQGRGALGVRVAINVFLTVVVVYAWAYAKSLQPTEAFTGLLSLLLLGSVLAGVVIRLMQPNDRSPEIYELFRINPRRQAPPQ